MQELEIEKFKLSFEVEDARNTLTGKFILNTI
jgi:hypothetical protein